MGRVLPTLSSPLGSTKLTMPPEAAAQEEKKMNTKRMLIIIGAIMGLQGIRIFLGAESITK